jgi:hypothetical protein
MWDIERYDWAHLRAMGSAAGVPAAIEALCRASSKAQSDDAYWRIDNVVVVQGRLFEAAFPTTVCLTSGLRTCSSVSQPDVLELLVQLGNGTPDPSESLLGSSNLAQLCGRELTREFGSFVSIFEESVLAGHADNVQHTLDLLFLCASDDDSLRGRVVWLFEKAISTGRLMKAHRDLIHECLAELRKPGS